jgi:hypothetical protein
MIFDKTQIIIFIVLISVIINWYFFKKIYVNERFNNKKSKPARVQAQAPVPVPVPARVPARVPVPVPAPAPVPVKEWKIIKGTANSPYINKTLDTVGIQISYKFMSSTGQYMYLIPCEFGNLRYDGSYTNYFWYSSDYGNTWTANTTINHLNYAINGSWIGFKNDWTNGEYLVNGGTCSSDGKYVYIAGNDHVTGYIYYSSNYGVTFTVSNKKFDQKGRITSLSCNSKGDILYIATVYGLYISKDYGATFTESSINIFLSSKNMNDVNILQQQKQNLVYDIYHTNGVCCSSDGKIVYYVSGDDEPPYASSYTFEIHAKTNTLDSGLWYSSDFGNSFIKKSNSKYFERIICNNDGSIAYAHIINHNMGIAESSDIFKITNSGNDISQITNCIDYNNIVASNICSQSVACDSTGLIVWIFSLQSSIKPVPFRKWEIKKSIDGGKNFITTITKNVFGIPIGTIACNGTGDIALANYYDTNNKIVKSYIGIYK